MQGTIPKDIPVRLCNEIGEENSRKRFSYTKTFCSVCKGRCIFGNENNRGCRRVNMRYDKPHEERSNNGLKLSQGGTHLPL